MNFMAVIWPVHRRLPLYTWHGSHVHMQEQQYRHCSTVIKAVLLLPSVCSTPTPRHAEMPAAMHGWSAAYTL
jgi:hypothetical protein